MASFITILTYRITYRYTLFVNRLFISLPVSLSTRTMLIAKFVLNDLVEITNLLSYYNATWQLLQPVPDDVNTTDWSLFDSPEGVQQFAGSIYDRTVNTLQECADLYIPKHKKGYYKFWWNQELDLLQEKDISSNKVWKVAGKTHSGPIFQQRNWDKFAYKMKTVYCLVIFH